jgi:hypothetical protein
MNIYTRSKTTTLVAGQIEQYLTSEDAVGGHRMSGTRFKLYPQPGFLNDFHEPETVQISSPAGTVGPGPSDHRIYTVYPIGKPEPYGISASPRGDESMLLPPWRGKILAPARPDGRGHFDYLEPGTPQFETAHLFGTVRFVLDIWERYFGRRITWHFAQSYERLELTVQPSLNNAQAGYGFIEVGGDWNTGSYKPFSLNFDVIAHEFGHILLYGEIGLPDPGLSRGEYWGFHESAADLVALISSLHFNSLVDELLVSTRGNLYMYNVLNRMGELSAHGQIRIAANDTTLSRFMAGWKDEHFLSQPLTGAFFDIFVDIFHEMLLDHGLIGPEVEDLSDQLLATSDYAPVMQTLFDQAFDRNPDGFKEALLLTRDTLGTYLADTWSRLNADDLTYVSVARAFEQVDRELNGGSYQRLIRGNFDMRDIGHVSVGPQLAPPGKDSHVNSVRTLIPRGT